VEFIVRVWFESRRGKEQVDLLEKQIDYIRLRSIQDMAVYKTRFFGDFEVDDINNEALIETIVENNGEDVDVSIMISNFNEIGDQIDEIIALLDQYYEIHEAAKEYIEKQCPENEGIAKFLFKYAGEALKKEYQKRGGKIFSLDLEDMIRHLDPPSIMFGKYRSGKILMEMIYNCPDSENGQLIISIDIKREIYHAEYIDYR
jgi:6-pyruvoyl-tetrahydropterin synthase